jgi:CubicO group peptidase (beta-lactamase class C family)
MRKLSMLVTILVCGLNPLLAQTISGKVLEHVTGEPLYHAHISCPETGEGAITDELGNFRLIISDSKKAKTLVVSYVGFLRQSKPIVSSGLIFNLLRDTTLLQVIEISPPNPLEIIRTAIKRIPENHGGQRLLNCFVRKYAKNKDKFIQVSEASYQWNQFASTYNQIKVFKARSVEDDKAFNGVGMHIGTPAASVRNLDFTMDIEGSFLGSKSLKKHEFFYEGITTRNGVEVHEISFDQKKIKDALYRGRLYIHTNSFAFVAAEAAISEKGISYFQIGNAAERAAMKLLNIDIRLLSQEQTISYREFGGKWYPDFMTMTEKLDCKSRRYNFEVPVSERADLLVTSIDTTFHRAFTEVELTKKGFIEAAGDSSKAFWENYNVIPSTIDYNVIALEIQSRNGYAHVKSALRDRIKNFPKDEAVRIDSVFTNYYNKGLFNGTALVKKHGKIIFHKGYGLADRERNTKNDTTTLFRIGSIAKTFTSQLIWQLKQESLLNYSDSVRKFIPWYPHPRVSIHHLLTHSSGIPNYTNNANFLDSIDHPFTTEELIRKFGLEKPAFPPGSEFSYSNTGYTLLALIAENVSGKNFGELLNDRIAKPLQLTNTGIARADAASSAKGYLGTLEEPYYSTGNMIGAGAIYSTTSDLLKWSDAHMNESMTELFVPHTWYHDWGSFYAYGWNIDKYQFWASKKHVIQYHGGTDFGFKSMLARQPDRDNVVIILNNTGEFPLFDITDVLFTIIN